MKILVIGNGFDLAHGLETKYIDFLKFVNQFNQVYEINERNSDFFLRSSDFIDFLIRIFRDNAKRTHEIIREFRKVTQDNIWIQHFNGILQANEKIGKNWIDFEKEIMNVIEWMEQHLHRANNLDEMEKIYSDVNNIKIIRGQFKADFDKKFLEYKGKGNTDVKGLEIKLIEDYLEHLEYLIRAFEIYINIYIYPTVRETKNEDILSLRLGSSDQIISFNYTDTYNRIYKNNMISPENTHFIHGRAREDNKTENNMIIGIDETLKSEEEINERLDYVGFKKYFQRIIKETDTSYINLFRKKGEGRQDINGNDFEDVDVYIFGHSLDRTDTDIIKTIFTAENTNITIYSRDKVTQKKQVSNLIAIIGKDELLKSTYNSEPKVKFKIQKENKDRKV